LIASPTAKAASSIGGSTLHSLLKLPTSNLKQPKILSLATIGSIRKKLQGVKYLIIDEFGMMGKLLFWHINMHLRQALNPKLPFGGLSIILAGDHNQLRPIADYVLYEYPVK
jgi:ATP-dependent DNA helicase PIF1